MLAIKKYPFRPKLDYSYYFSGKTFAFFRDETVKKGDKIIRRSYAPVIFERIKAREEQAAQLTKEYTPTLKDRIKKIFKIKIYDAPIYTPDVLEITLKKPSKPIDSGTIRISLK